MKGGAGKLKFVCAELIPRAQQGVGFVTLPLWIGKTHREGINTFDIAVQCVQCIWLNFLRRKVDGLWNLWQEKKLAKNLEMDATTIN